MKIKHKHDFKALSLKFSEDAVAPHIIYIKEHSVREHTKDKPSGRTLFIVNIPPYVDSRGLISAFSEAGKVESLNFTLKPNEVQSITSKLFIPQAEKVAFRVAYMVFEKVSSLDKALALTQLRPVNFDEHVKCGLTKWIEKYNSSVLAPHVMKKNIELFMKTHDTTTQKAKLKEKQLEMEDDDGWVTVTKRGKVQSFARTDKVEHKIMAKEEKNKKRKELKNFYTFQIRESKMKHIVALRQKFEEDKNKIAQIKQSRRFKPF